MKHFILFLLLASASAQAQQDTTPQNCQQLIDKNPGNLYAYAFAAHCRRSEASTGQILARMRGQPVPSTEVLQLPARGTDAAKTLGLACISGLAMRRLENGWAQVRNDKYQYVRCEAYRD